MSGKNTITRSVSKGSIFESAKAIHDATITYNQGDLLCFDSSAHLIKIPAVEGDGSTFLGVATESVTSGKLNSPYTTAVDAAAAISDVPGPAYGVIAKCRLKPSDTLNPGDLVYLYPTDSRGVQASGTKAIGVYQGATVTGAPSTSYTEVEVLLGHRYPGDTLAF